MSVGKGSMLEDLKISIPQVTWGLFTWTSGYQGSDALRRTIDDRRGERFDFSGIAGADLNWPRVVFYFASHPAVLRIGILALALFLGIHFI
jgi:hypothetical protein